MKTIWVTGMLGVVHEGRLNGTEIGVSKFEL